MSLQIDQAATPNITKIDKRANVYIDGYFSLHSLYALIVINPQNILDTTLYYRTRISYGLFIFEI